MITKISVVAGEIWRILEKESKLPLSILISRIEKNIAEEKDIIFMGVGWLAREGHIILERTDLGYAVYLREPSLK